MQVGELKILDDIILSLFPLLSLFPPLSLFLSLSPQTRVYEAMRRVDDVIDLKVTTLFTHSHAYYIIIIPWPAARLQKWLLAAAVGAELVAIVCECRGWLASFSADKNPWTSTSTSKNLMVTKFLPLISPKVTKYFHTDCLQVRSCPLLQ